MGTLADWSRESLTAIGSNVKDVAVAVLDTGSLQ